MDQFLAPAYFVLGRMRNESKFGFMALLFGLPAFVLVWMEHTSFNALLAAGLLLLTLYFAVTFYLQAMKGWGELLPLLDLLSHGDLTGVYGSTADRVSQFAELKGLGSTSMSTSAASSRKPALALGESTSLRARSRRATPTCRSALKNKPRRWSKLPLAWSSSPPR